MNKDLQYYSTHNSEQNNCYAYDMLLRGMELGSMENQILGLLKGVEPETFKLPDTVKGGFDKALKDENVMRTLATVKSVNVSSGKIQVDVSDADAAIVADSGAYPEDSDTTSDITFGAYKIAGLCKLNNTFINDRNYDVKEYLSTTFARRFGRAEENLFINGTGINQPKGFLVNAEVGVELEGTTFTADNLVELYFSLDKRMRKNACWIMSDETALKVRKLKDNSGRYLWCDDNTILGKRVIISNYMTDDEKPIAFGDFSYYWIIERSPLEVRVLKELFARNDKTGFACNERLDGKLIRTDAVKLLTLESE